MCLITFSLGCALPKCKEQKKVVSKNNESNEAAKWKAAYEAEHEARVKAEAQVELLKGMVGGPVKSEQYTAKQCTALFNKLLGAIGIVPHNKKKAAVVLAKLFGLSPNYVSQKMNDYDADKSLEEIAQDADEVFPELSAWIRKK
jgi:hypothetical protein